ncbi:hypothetical protein PCASD_25686 [Puccinia coronata f. sp. avenae]|uniref:Uncharacterized protein n=1 Tax=Puccinia coronata f. sp. avenae TaxID=200324 RepID=A0A2N5TIP3_9BASI|nr:hypothetical protein PCASD_25686 [Puccinia coronata f. sp. avenae]
MAEIAPVSDLIHRNQYLNDLVVYVESCVGVIALTAAGEGLTGQADAKTDGLVRPADAEGECLGADAKPDGLVGPADAEGECLDDAPKELSALRVGEPEGTPLPPRRGIVKNRGGLERNHMMQLATEKIVEG